MEVEWHASPARDQQRAPQPHPPLARSARGDLCAAHMLPAYGVLASCLIGALCSRARAHRRRAAVDGGARRRALHGPAAVVVAARQLPQPTAMVALAAGPPLRPTIALSV